MAGKKKQTQGQLSEGQRDELGHALSRVEHAQTLYWLALGDLEKDLREALGKDIELDSTRDYSELDIETLVKETRDSCRFADLS